MWNEVETPFKHKVTISLRLWSKPQSVPQTYQRHLPIRQDGLPDLLLWPPVDDVTHSALRPEEQAGWLLSETSIQTKQDTKQDQSLRLLKDRHYNNTSTFLVNTYLSITEIDPVIGGVWDVTWQRQHSNPWEALPGHHWKRGVGEEGRKRRREGEREKRKVMKGSYDCGCHGFCPD